MQGSNSAETFQMGVFKLEALSDRALGEQLYPKLVKLINASLGDCHEISELHEYLMRYQNPFDPYNVIEKLDAGICVFEPPGRFVYVNDKTVEALGFERFELLGKSWHTVLPPDYKYIIAENRLILRRFKRFGWVKVAVLGKDGRKRYIRMKGKFINLNGTMCILAIQLWEHLFDE